MRVRLEVAMRKQGEKREREETVKRKQKGEAARERRGGVKRRSRLIFFFFCLAPLSGGLQKFQSSLLRNSRPSLNFSTLPFLFHNDRRSHPPDHVHGLCRQARALQGTAESKQRAEGLGAGGTKFRIDAFDPSLLLSLSVNKRKARERGKPKKTQNSAIFARGIVPPAVLGSGYTWATAGPRMCRYR